MSLPLDHATSTSSAFSFSSFSSSFSSSSSCRRDLYVISECVRRGVPVACVIGGGYDKDRAALARRHTIVHRAARDAWVWAGFHQRR